MRNASISLVLLAGLALGGQAVAADGPESVDYNCALFDECGAESPARVEQPKAGRVSGGTRGGFTLRRNPVESAKPAAKTTAKPSGTNSARAPALATSKPTATPGRAQAASISAAQQITFVSGSAELQPSAKQVAQKLASAMQRPDKIGLRFRIEGHTDAVGSRELNQDLSTRRAQSVAAYLGSLGVDVRRLDVVGYGFDRPLAGYSKLSAANRRVVAAVVK